LILRRDRVDERIPELYATERIPFERRVIYQRYQIKELEKERDLAFGYANPKEG